jgi:hypothetical protein
MTRTIRSVLVLACFLSAGLAQAADDAGLEFFEKKIRPVLAAHCYECHANRTSKRKGGLTLDTRAGLRQGGDSGPAVVPGKPAESLLLTAVHYEHPDLKMPPKGKLPASVIADLEAWVQMGAPDPRDRVETAADVAWEQVLRERRRWWSLQPVRSPPLPPGAGHPLDRFLQARRAQAGLVAAGPAEPRTLLRRLSLVLTGLPPTPEEVEEYVRAARATPQAAAEEVVDRLLASPHFGERWARHWLDVVRFTETHGNEWNYEVHHAWRYRDYLIRAFNQDVPYDQIIREHIAGDLLETPRPDSVVGTAFYRFGEVNHDDCIEFRQIGYDLADNQIDTLTKAFQATTVACARCHDHKLDAVSMRDYYALLGILRSSRLVSHTLDDAAANAAPKARLRALKELIRRELAEQWRADVQGLDARRLESWRAALKSDKLPLEDPLHPWLALQKRGSAGVSETWRQLADSYGRQQRERAEFNAGNFVAFGLDRWLSEGQGLADGPAGSGDFALAPSGTAVLSAVYPAGTYTHLLSAKLNGALRSPVLPARRFISFHVLGGKTSAVRLVSNNCQLNYVNYRALTRDEFEWKRFAIPADAPSLRTYAELMTKFDNPKFPDQLGTLGGDSGNARVPWEQAAADPRSFFGITQAVVHDCEETPRPDLGHLLPLFAGEVRDEAEAARRYAHVAAAAVEAWSQGRASDAQVRWLDWLLRRGLLGNSIQATPRLAALVAEYRQIEETLALPRIVPGIADAMPAFDQPLLARGDSRKPGAVVPRRYLEVLDVPEPNSIRHGSGRRELAECIASARNPLTARVMVNRLWHHLFGSGIVRTVDDFGRAGEQPTHPELLDYLADRFVAEGWSIKRMLRFLVLSEAFRMSSTASAAARTADPDNRLLHHYPARRLEAEAIRDSILTASGRLDCALFGPSIHPYRDKANADRRLFPGPLDGHGRRSLYIRVNLMEAPQFLGAFNFPGGKVTQGRRDVTNVPAQALALLNDPFVLQQADYWAERLLRQTEDAAARVERMFQTALGRPPTAEERERFVAAVGRFAQLHGAGTEQVLTCRAAWAELAHAMFNLKEFIYVR